MKTVEVEVLPDCDLCKMEGAVQTGTVRYDTPVAAHGGTWGYLCQRHFRDFGNRGMATKIRQAPG